MVLTILSGLGKPASYSVSKSVMNENLDLLRLAIYKVHLNE
jgi:hypothetical protein